MTLTPEDGTGLADADSYLSLVTFAAYAEGRGYDITGFDDAAIEVAARDTFEWVNGFRYKATRLTNAQAGAFPRDGLTDWDGFTVEGVPKRVKDAQGYMMFAVLGGAVTFEDMARGGGIKSETVGPISVSYKDDAPARTVFSRAETLLQPYIRDANSPRLNEVYDGSQARDPVFEIGQMDFLSLPDPTLSDS